MKRKKILLIILFILLAFVIIKILTIMYFSKVTKEAIITTKTQTTELFSYNLFDLLESINCDIEIENENGIVYQKNCNFKATINNIDINQKIVLKEIFQKHMKQ